MNTEDLIDLLKPSLERIAESKSTSVFGYAFHNHLGDTFYTVCHGQFMNFPTASMYWTKYDWSKVSEVVAKTYYEFIVSEETSPWRDIIEYNRKYLGVPVYSWEFVKEFGIVPWFRDDVSPQHVVGFFIALREQFEFWENINFWYELVTIHGMDKHLAYVFVHKFTAVANGSVESFPMSHSYLPIPQALSDLYITAKCLKNAQRSSVNTNTLKESRNYAPFWGALDAVYKRFWNRDKQIPQLYNYVQDHAHVTKYMNHATFTPREVVSKRATVTTVVEAIIKAAKEYNYA